MLPLRHFFVLPEHARPIVSLLGLKDRLLVGTITPVFKQGVTSNQNEGIQFVEKQMETIN
jgi:hypothetical protein